MIDSLQQFAGFESVHSKYMLLTNLHVAVKNVQLQRSQSKIGYESRDLIFSIFTEESIKTEITEPVNKTKIVKQS